MILFVMYSRFPKYLCIYASKSFKAHKSEIHPDSECVKLANIPFPAQSLRIS